jgi:hypothetical protein
MAPEKKKNRKAYSRQDYENLIKGPPQKRKKRSQKGGAAALKSHLPILLNMTPQFNKNATQRKKLVEQMSTEQKKVLADICTNFLNQKYAVPADFVKKMAKSKKQIYALANKKASLKEIKSVVSQKGGAVGGILPVIASLVLPELLKLVRL